MTKETEYRVWSPSHQEDGPIFIENISGIDPVHDKVLHGLRENEPYPKLVVDEYSGRMFTDILANYLGHYIVSDDLRKILDGVDAIDMQFIPLGIKGQKARTFWIANLITSLSCIDRETSVYTTFEPDDDDIFELEKWVLKPLPENAPPLIRVEELPLVYLIRKDLQDTLLASVKYPGTFEGIKDFRI